MELGFVYRVKNRRNNKSYVGETVHLRERFRSHIKHASSSRLRADIKRYGVKNFVFEILEICLFRDERKRLEAYYIKKFRCCDPTRGYNTSMRDKALREWKNPRIREARLAARTPEYKIKLSQAARTQWADPRMRRKMKRAVISWWVRNRKRNELAAKQRTVVR